MSHEHIADNLKRVQQRIAATCERVGRAADEVQLVAVTKYSSMEEVRALIACGHQILGESRPQQLAARANELNDASIEWHMIGHLQRNKVRQTVPHAKLIHSVDSLRLLQQIDQVGEELNSQPSLLLQVNVSGEEAKHGFSPKELREEWSSIQEFQNVKICGLMTMAPLTEHDHEIRQTFGGLRLLRDELDPQTTALHDLSMGMSNDFEIAIEEGATLIRLGSVLFTPQNSDI